MSAWQAINTPNSTPATPHQKWAVVRGEMNSSSPGQSPTKTNDWRTEASTKTSTDFQARTSSRQLTDLDVVHESARSKRSYDEYRADLPNISDIKRRSRLASVPSDTQRDEISPGSSNSPNFARSNQSSRKSNQSAIEGNLKTTSRTTRNLNSNIDNTLRPLKVSWGHKEAIPPKTYRYLDGLMLLDGSPYAPDIPLSETPFWRDFKYPTLPSIQAAARVKADSKTAKIEADAKIKAIQQEEEERKKRDETPPPPPGLPKCPKHSEWKGTGSSDRDRNGVMRSEEAEECDSDCFEEYDPYDYTREIRIALRNAAKQSVRHDPTIHQSLNSLKPRSEVRQRRPYISSNARRLLHTLSDMPDMSLSGKNLQSLQTRLLINAYV